MARYADGDAESTVLELRMVEQGFDVKTARSMEAARKLLTTDGVEFDLVVSELDLSDGHGLSFLSEARKEKWGRDMPWVIHTQKQGRAGIFASYRLRIAGVVRDYTMDERGEAPRDSVAAHG